MVAIRRGPSVAVAGHGGVVERRLGGDRRQGGEVPDRAAATRSSTRACGRPTGRRPGRAPAGAASTAGHDHGAGTTTASPMADTRSSVSTVSTSPGRPGGAGDQTRLVEGARDGEAGRRRGARRRAARAWPRAGPGVGQRACRRAWEPRRRRRPAGQIAAPAARGDAGRSSRWCRRGPSDSIGGGGRRRRRRGSTSSPAKRAKISGVPSRTRPVPSVAVHRRSRPSDGGRQRGS